MRARGDSELHPFTVAFGDLAVTFGAYLLSAGWISVEGFAEPFTTAMPWLGLVTVFLIHTLNLTVVRGRSPGDAVRAAVVSTLLISTGIMGGFLMLLPVPFAVATLVIPVLAQTGAVLLWRLCCSQAGRWLRGRRRVLVVGTAAEADYLTAKLTQGTGQDDEAPLHATSVSDALGRLGQVNSVLLAPSLTQVEKNALLAECLVSGRECMVVPDSYELSLCQAEVRQIQDLPVLAVRPIGLSRVQQLAKRGYDVVMAALMLVLLLPVWLVVAVAVKLSSKGPLFYTQERVGRGGRQFSVIKFRTMRPDAEADTGPVLATAGDPRVTPVGRLLRATRLDETPQLLNVLGGSMSIVGPRPERQYFIDVISRELPDYRYRLLVQPGLTGLAQVEAGYDARPEDKLRYDLLYIQSFSLLMDLRILLATARVVLLPSKNLGVQPGDKRAGSKVGA